MRQFRWIHGFFACFGLVLASGGGGPGEHPVFAMGKKPASSPQPSPESGGGAATPFARKPIGLGNIRQESIELPDGKRWEFGQDFQARLSTVLTQSGELRVVDESPTGVDPKQTGVDLRAIRRRAESEEPWVWAGSTTPAARVRFKTEALSFVTGSRGERMMYGFDSRRPHESVEGKEEFPLRELAFEPNWFDRHFEARGTAPFDSFAGLDLGDGFKLDAIFAFFTYKQARYRARLELAIEIEPGFEGVFQTRRLGVSGEGFFFDVAGGYLQYSAGIRIARTDAILQVFRRAIEATQSEIQEAVREYPLLAKIDGVLPSEQLVFLGTGPDSRVRAGTRFQVGERLELEVLQSLRSGSVARLIAGAFSELTPGLLAVEVRPHRLLAALRSERSTPSREILLPRADLPKVDLQGTVPAETWLQALWKSLVDSALLPYRIWRSYQFDQTYQREADRGESLAEFRAHQQKSRWASWSGFASVFSSSEWEGSRRIDAHSPVVAILDTGVDYNHPVLHSSLWLNPRPTLDSQGRQDFYGWDFVSGDARPFDDHDRGTELASLVLTVAPQARILPVKVFNPFGITSKGALEAGFEYALAQKADVILCGWATRRKAEVLSRMIQKAHEGGVLVVAAAGDRGDNLNQEMAYPASFARDFPQSVLAVAALDASGENVVQTSGRFSNIGNEVVQLAAPGEGLRVARPRGRVGSAAPSSAFAAALVAGAAARLGAEVPAGERVEFLLRTAQQRPGLRAAVQEGRRLLLSSESTESTDSR